MAPRTLAVQSTKEPTVTRFLLSGALVVAAAWSAGASVSAAMLGNTERMIAFGAWTLAALSFSGLTLMAGKR